MATREESGRLTRKICVAAAAACALGLAGVVARQDVSTAPNALAQFYGPGGPVYGASAAGEQAYQRATALQSHHQVLAHMCFGNDCANVPPAFAKALISTEKGAYAKAYNAGEAAERRELVAAKPHQVGDIIDGMRPMRVAMLRDQVAAHEAQVAAPPPSPVWHSEWQKLFGTKKNPGHW